MKDVLKRGNIISKIRDGIDLGEIADYAKNQVFSNGPVDTVVLEILSYFKLFQPSYFENFELEIIETMGLFYKNPEPDTLQGVVFDMYSQYIRDTYGENYTPMQADILKQIKNKQFFSFSAPTSTGKSFVFRNLIKGCQNDVVIIVPSRALINEYYDRIVEIVDVKSVNVLAFVDRINIKHTTRNIFILTPERARELFKNKNWLKIDLFLFDEAQLSDEKYNEYKDAINNDQFSDEYNLTNSDLEKLKTDNVTTIIPTLLDMMFVDGNLVSPDVEMKEIYDDFQSLYQEYLGRELEVAEKAVLSSAIKIMIWKVYGRTFRLICQYRYAYASKVAERRRLNKEGKKDEADKLNAKFMYGCHDLPDKKLKSYPLVSTKTYAKDVDYDLIVYDTYDYLDKLIGFKLSDIFYAMFHQYYKETNDYRSEKLAKYFKYGTDKENEILMLRYGLTFEDIEWIEPCIDCIDENEIVFNDKVADLDDIKSKVVEKYIYE